MTRQDSGRGYGYGGATAYCSSGVIADDAHELRRIQVVGEVPVSGGIGSIVGALERLGLDAAALCAVELRSPVAMAQEAFGDFNRGYVEQLRDHGILLADGANPVARTNVCPLGGDLAAPIVHAFSYVTERTTSAAPTFVISGGAEPAGYPTPDSNGTGTQSIDESRLLAKAEWVLDEIESRLVRLGQSWPRCTNVEIYSRHRSLRVEDIVVGTVGAEAALTWWQVTPPIRGLEFEVDCRRVLHTEYARIG